VTILTPEIHPSPDALSCSMLLTLSAPEPVQFTDGISACGERFIATVTHVLVMGTRPEWVSVLLLRTSPKRTTLSLITHVDVERRMHISG
jgi:hypothetical protein